MRRPISMIAMVLGALALMTSAFISSVGATPPDRTTTTVSEAKKVFVCKYVGKPGVDEVLQSGNNPISVSVNAIRDYNGVGSYFNDAQGRSYVLAEDTRTGGGQEGEPSVDSCPVPSTTTTQVEETTTTTEVEETTTTTEQPTTTTTEVQVTTTVPEVTVPPTTEPPVVTTESTTVTLAPPLSVAVPSTAGPVPRVTPRPAPVVVDGELAHTGASDLVPILTLLGIALLVSGAILSRKAARI